MGKSNAKQEKTERINALRKKYDNFINEDKKRKERNEDILERLDKMRSTALALRYSNKISQSMPPTRMIQYNNSNEVVETMQIIPVNRQVPRNIISPINLDENELINKISEKYILIPRLTTLLLEDKNKLHPKELNEDDDWTSKYEILDKLKSTEKSNDKNKIYDNGYKNNTKSKHISFDDKTETRGLYNLKRDVIDHEYNATDLVTHKKIQPGSDDNIIAENREQSYGSKQFEVNTDSKKNINRCNEIKVMHNDDKAITGFIKEQTKYDDSGNKNYKYKENKFILNNEDNNMYGTIIQPNKSKNYNNENKNQINVNKKNEKEIVNNESLQKNVEISQLAPKQIQHLNDQEGQNSHVYVIDQSDNNIKDKIEHHYVQDQLDEQQHEQNNTSHQLYAQGQYSEPMCNNSEYIKVNDQNANNLQEDDQSSLNIQNHLHGDQQQYDQTPDHQQHYNTNQYNELQYNPEIHEGLQIDQPFDQDQYNINQQHYKQIPKQNDQQVDQQQYLLDQYNVNQQHYNQMPQQVDEDKYKQYVQEEYNMPQQKYEHVPKNGDQQPYEQVNQQVDQQQYVKDEYNMHQLQYEPVSEQGDQQQYIQDQYNTNQQQYNKLPTQSDQQVDQEPYVQEEYQQQYEQTPEEGDQQVDQEPTVQEEYQQQYKEAPEQGYQQVDQEPYVQDGYQQQYEQTLEQGNQQVDQEQYVQDQHQQQYEQIPEHDDNQHNQINNLEDQNELQQYSQDQYDMNQQQYEQIPEQMLAQNFQQDLVHDQQQYLQDYGQQQYDQNVQQEFPIEPQHNEQAPEQTDEKVHIQQQDEQVSNAQQYVQDQE